MLVFRYDWLKTRKTEGLHETSQATNDRESERERGEQRLREKPEYLEVGDMVNSYEETMALYKMQGWSNLHSRQTNANNNNDTDSVYSLLIISL